MRGNALELPFPDNYFDLVVCNGVLEWIGMMNSNIPPREAQLSFLREVKRVLSKTGCLYVGIENRFGLPFLLGGKDHSGLPYTSLLPRRVANFAVKKFGYAGGIYGDKSKRIKEQKGYYTYTYSIWGYRKLFGQAGFRFKSYWAFTSYNEPYFSGRLEDKIGLKAFVQYYGSIVKRFKTLISIIQKMPKLVIGLMVSLLSPSFLFYCYKNDLTDSVDDIIVRNTGLQSFTTLSEGSGIMYLLYDKTGKPAKVVRLKRFGYDLPTVLPFYDKTSPISHDARNRIWLEDWIPGKTLDPLNLNEIKLAIDWLIDFQNKKRKAAMNKNDIQLEVDYIRSNLSQIRDLVETECMKWLHDYEVYVDTIRIDKTAEHGDFWQGNILVNPSKNKINVIDWQYYREDGNPFFDFIFFIINILLLGGGIEEFSSNLNESGRLSPITKEMNCKINNYFGFELNLEILVRYVILRFIIRKQLEGGPHDKTTMIFKKLINTLKR